MKYQIERASHKSQNTYKINNGHHYAQNNRLDYNKSPSILPFNPSIFILVSSTCEYSILAFVSHQFLPHWVFSCVSDPHTPSLHMHFFIFRYNLYLIQSFLHKQLAQVYQTCISKAELLVIMMPLKRPSQQHLRRHFSLHHKPLHGWK